MAVLKNAERVRETTTTTGTGAYALAGAPTGFRTFNAGVGVGNLCHYAVEMGADYEVGIGTLSASTTLARTVILKSSNADAAVSWAAGTKNIFIAMLSERTGLEPFAPFNWLVSSPDKGTTVQGIDGVTGQKKFSGSDWATIVNSILDESDTQFSIFIDPNVPDSTGTITIDKSDVSLFCPKRVTKANPKPYVRRITTGGTNLSIRRVWFHGIHADEMDIHGEGNNFNWQEDIEGVTLEGCMTEDFQTAGRRGLRFTGAGDQEHITVRDHFATVASDGTSETDPKYFICFEGTTLGTGHIEFENFWGENSVGADNISAILYKNGGRTGPTVRFTGSFVFINGTCTGCHIMQTNQGTPTQDAGPEDLHFVSLHLEIQAAGMDLFRINNNAAGSSYFNVHIDHVNITTGPFAYNWVNQLETGFIGSRATFRVNQGLIQFGYTSFGVGTVTDPSVFVVDIHGVRQWNPRGAITVTVDASPFTWTNNEAVDCAIYLSGGTVTLVERSIGLSTSSWITVFTGTNVTLYVLPRESVRITWNTTAPTMIVDRK